MVFKRALLFPGFHGSALPRNIKSEKIPQKCRSLEKFNNKKFHTHEQMFLQVGCYICNKISCSLYFPLSLSNNNLESTKETIECRTMDNLVF